MTPEATYKLVERILDENSAWIARPSPKVTQLIADAITEAVQREAAWQPIETAPKDGTVVLLHVTCLSQPFTVTALYKRDDYWEGWVSSYEHEDVADPSHWQPLPAPPAAIRDVK
jgi:thioesterase domain-containing protein